MTLREGADHIGELQAWDLDAEELVWQGDFPDLNWGSVLTTAAGISFSKAGPPDRYFRAFDARTGEELWNQRLSSGVMGVPVTYAIDGVQCVAVQSGWGVDPASMTSRVDRVRGTFTYVPRSGTVWVFAADDLR